MDLINQWTYYYLNVDGTFNDSLSYLDYRKQKPNAKIKAIKGHAEQNKSAFAFSKKVDEND